MTQRGIFVGVGGRYGAGKDVVADLYKYEFEFVKLGMSDVLNDCLKTLDPYVVVDSETTSRYSTIVEALGYTEAKTIPEVRRLLQVFGTEVGRKMFHQDFWVDLTQRRVLEKLDQGINVVLTGVRYPNELDMVTALNGHTVWVERPSKTETGTHDSEISLSPDWFDTVLVNDGTLSELEDKAALLYLTEIKRGT